MHETSTVPAEHGLDGTSKVIGVAFDGTGDGTAAAVWGGGVLVADHDGILWFAQLAYVPLPGGDAAVERPYRMALSHLRAAGIAWTADLPCVQACPPEELRPLATQLARSLDCVATSSMGRLFDAVSSLAGICHTVGHEGQAAMELEAAARGFTGPQGVDAADVRYRFALRPAEPDTRGATLIADPAPVFTAIVADVRAAAPTALIAASFHDAVVDLVRRVCTAARFAHGTDTVALAGGMFANTLLSSACAETLHQDGFTILRHQRVRPNDGVAAGPAYSPQETPSGCSALR